MREERKEEKGGRDEWKFERWKCRERKEGRKGKRKGTEAARKG